jgi:hemolysin activation/secretion protein
VKLLPVALLLTGSQFIAHAVAAAPDSGGILQQIQSLLPPPVSTTSTGLSIDRENTATLPASAPFLVKTLRISGNEKISTAILHALVAEAEGKTLTLSDLERFTDRITDYYQVHGYPLARAIIPAQSIHDAVVEIEIIEARYAQIKLDNHSRLNDPLLQGLLLLSDIPGIVVNATLQPGEAVGTSDLLVATTPGPAVTATVALDNYGNRYTGSAGIGGSVNLIDPRHHGDVLSVSALSY